MKTIFSVFQLLVSIFLILVILVQKRGTALGSVFGGIGSSYFERRGLEKKLFWLTCILASLFILTCLLNFIF